ncbi:MAG: L,D-transpeptidase family protein [Alphaproteobacteria bacterium]|nr:L,D-transpeptidase family protein [Alphaproteobacteria bacterium]
MVSIDKQRATLFADGNPIASTAVSTGTPGHPTPMGMFSIIQKSRHHVSNLYGASMPYMQRITWSGSALHQGPLPGYPASHGCVRLTENFAQLLWKTTKMGARVIITRPEVAPIEFDHARLFVPKPQMAESPPLPLPAPKPAAAAPALTPLPAVVATEPAFTSSVAKVRTADASNAIAVMTATGDDAKAVANSVVTEPAADAPAAEQATKSTDGSGGSAKELVAEATSSAEHNSGQAEARPAATDAQVAEASPVETKTAEAETAEVKPAEAEAAVTAEPVPSEIKSAATKPADIKPAEAVAVDAVAVEAKSAPLAAPAPIMIDERPKAMPPAAVREANGRPISVFVSLKDSKLYVRQGWKPLFDAPVSFERPDQPVGTHVYTAMGMKVSGEGLRWTVVSIPSGYRRMAELKGSNAPRKGRAEPVKDVEAPVPNPAAALDRLVMAPELVERISSLITAGSSLIVSDNKMSEETGEYTDFIVTTR